MNSPEMDGRPPEETTGQNIEKNEDSYYVPDPEWYLRIIESNPDKFLRKIEEYGLSRDKLADLSERGFIDNPELTKLAQKAFKDGQDMELSEEEKMAVIWWYLETKSAVQDERTSNKVISWLRKVVPSKIWDRFDSDTKQKRLE